MDILYCIFITTSKRKAQQRKTNFSRPVCWKILRPCLLIREFISHLLKRRKSHIKRTKHVSYLEEYITDEWTFVINFYFMKPIIDFTCSFKKYYLSRLTRFSFTVDRKLIGFLLQSVVNWGCCFWVFFCLLFSFQ